MDAERIEGIIRRELDSTDYSELDDVIIFRSDDYFQAIKAAAVAVAKNLAAKSEPPEPPKTVLPDTSGLKPGTDAWFFAEDGTRVSCFCCFDGECQWSAGGEEGFSPSYFVSRYPHLGRLRKAVPGEVAE